MDFHKRCVLVTKMVKISLKTTEAVLCFTAATDGVIAVWHVDSFMKERDKSSKVPLISFRVHQSGVNCLDLFTIEGRKLIFLEEG